MIIIHPFLDLWVSMIYTYITVNGGRRTKEITMSVFVVVDMQTFKGLVTNKDTLEEAINEAKELTAVGPGSFVILETKASVTNVGKTEVTIL